MHVHDSLNLSVITLCSRSRCGAREAMTVGCKPTMRAARGSLNQVLTHAARTRRALVRASSWGAHSASKMTFSVLHSCWLDLLGVAAHFHIQKSLKAPPLWGGAAASRALRQRARARQRLRRLDNMRACQVFVCSFTCS